MNVSVAKLLINKHNNGEIHIHTILSESKALISNIKSNSKLNFNEEMQTLTYVNEYGLVHTVTNVSVIDEILYYNSKGTNNDDSSDNNNNNCNNNDCDCDETCDCGCRDNNETFPNSTILSQGFIKNGVIYPTELEDGTLIYDCAMGTLREFVCGKPNGIIKTSKNIFSSYFGDGYALIQYGLLDMNLYIPDSGMYSIMVRAGSENDSGKRGSFFVNNVERFIRTSANMKGVWEIKKPEKYCEADDYFLEVESTKLLSGSNKFTLRIDQSKGTINNCYDCIILKKNSIGPEDPDCKEYFHITEAQYIELKKNIDELNSISNELKETLNRTFITLDNITELLDLSSDQLINGRIVKVNNVGNGTSGYYVYNNTSGWVKFDFSDPKAFITLDNYMDLVEFTENNKDLLVHGKLVRVNRPKSDEIDITIEEPADFRKPAYYYYDIHSEHWLAINISGNGSSLTKKDVEDLIKEHNDDLLNSHSNTFISVNSLTERDSISKVDGRIVRVNSVTDSDGNISSKYYRWDAKNSVWVTESFAQGFDENTIVKVSQIENFEGEVEKVFYRCINESEELSEIITEKVTEAISNNEELNNIISEKVTEAISDEVLRPIVEEIVEDEVEEQVAPYFSWSDETI